MIKVHDLLPGIYYKESRDFQSLGRVYEVLFNYLKTESDLSNLDLLSSNSNIKLLPLLAKTLGFDSKHDYNIQDLKALCSSFVGLLRYKGSIIAIDEAVKILLNSQHINSEFDIVPSDNDPYNLEIFLPKEINDLVLLEDLFNYILPVGYTYNFVYADFSSPIKTMLTSKDAVKFKNFSSNKIGQVARADNSIRPKVSNLDEIENLGLTFTGIVAGPNVSQGEINEK